MVGRSSAIDERMRRLSGATKLSISQTQVVKQR